MGNELLTVAILLACGVCIAKPSLMRDRGPVFVALGVGLVLLLLAAVATMFLVLGARSLAAFLGGVATLLQLVAVVLLVLGVSGLSVADLAAEISAGLRSFASAGPRGFSVVQPAQPARPHPGHDPAAAAPPDSAPHH